MHYGKKTKMAHLQAYCFLHLKVTDCSDHQIYILHLLGNNVNSHNMRQRIYLGQEMKETFIIWREATVAAEYYKVVLSH